MDERWHPLLEGETADRARAAIAEIAASTAGASVESDEPWSLSGGAGGAAVFYAYLAVHDGRSEHRVTAGKLLDAAVSEMRGRDPSLYGGVAGVAWALEHLEPGRGRGAAFDPALRDLLARGTWRGTYDLIMGLVGLGVYALERLPDPTARECLELVVERLTELAEAVPGGVSWRTPARLLPPPQAAELPDGYYNLGLAHGVPAVVVLLAGALSAGVAGGETRRLLAEAVAWLLAQRLPDGGRSCFPSFVAPGHPPDPARTAWCYGDPGIAVALLLAARATGSPEWEADALDLARVAASRDQDEAQVRDAGLCHGAAGLGHLFNRIHQATGDAVLGDAARAWLELALDMRDPDRGVAGFPALIPDQEGPRWVADPGLLMGSTGVGLAFLAATGAVEPAWDRILMLSLR